MFLRLDAIQVRALSCLDNMFSLVDVDLQCDQHVLEAIWNALFHLGFDKTGLKPLEIVRISVATLSYLIVMFEIFLENIYCRRNDSHFMESVIGTMRSLLQRLHHCNSKV